MASTVTELLRRRFGGKKDDGYITDGLAFHLDCADCTVSTWTDKVGGIVFDMENTSIGADGGVVFNGSNAKGVGRSALSGLLASGCTIEVCYNFTNYANMLLFESNIANGIAYGTYIASNLTKYIIWKQSTPGIKGATANTSGGTITHAINNDRAFINSQNTGFVVTTDYWGIHGSFPCVGARLDNRYYFNGVIYQIRIYNRILSADEILHNQEIDIKNYNIAI